MFNSNTYSSYSPAGSNEEAVNSPLNPPSNQSSSGSSSGYGGSQVKYVDPYFYAPSCQGESSRSQNFTSVYSNKYMTENIEVPQKKIQKLENIPFESNKDYSSLGTYSYFSSENEDFKSPADVVKQESIEVDQMKSDGSTHTFLSTDIDSLKSHTKTIKQEQLDVDQRKADSPKQIDSNREMTILPKQKINVLDVTGKCQVCGDKANIEYFGVLCCDSCRGFFKRTIKNNKEYSCSLGKSCTVDKKTRNHCQGCRIEKCFHVGMKKEEVEKELEREKLKRQEKKKAAAVRKCASVDSQKQENLTVDLAAVSAAELFVDPKIEEFANVSFDPIRQLCLAADKQLASLTEWAKRMPHFTELTLHDQVKLLQWNWAELLIGGFCYRSSAVTDGILLSTGLHLSKENLEKAGVGALVNKLFSEVINKMRHFQIDITEWGCLRAIMLFAPDTKELKDIDTVENIREKYTATLSEYIKKTYPNDDHRLSGLLLRLAPLKAIALQVLEHLFFFKILGNVPIDTFLLEMLDSDSH